MADRIVVLRAGRIEQVGTPLDLYNHPANRFVAGFIGSPKMNFVKAVARRSGGALALDVAGSGSIPLPKWPGSVKDLQDVTLGIRPEHIELGQGGLPVVINLAEQLGGNTVLHGSLGDGQQLVLQVVGQTKVARGETVPVIIPADRCHIFDDQGAIVSAT